MAAPAAGPPSTNGPDTPLPAGVLSQSVAGSTARTASSLGMYIFPPPKATPQASMLTVVALAGPPAPPATLVLVPVAGVCAPATAGLAPNRTATSPATPRATPRPCRPAPIGFLRLVSVRPETPEHDAQAPAPDDAGLAAPSRAGRSLGANRTWHRRVG